MAVMHKIYSTPRYFRHGELRINEPDEISFVTVNTRLVRNCVRRMYKNMRKHGISDMMARTQIYHTLSDIAISPESISWVYGPEFKKEKVS